MNLESFIFIISPLVFISERVAKYQALCNSTKGTDSAEDEAPVILSDMGELEMQNLSWFLNLGNAHRTHAGNRKSSCKPG